MDPDQTNVSNDSPVNESTTPSDSSPKSTLTSKVQSYWQALKNNPNASAILVVLVIFFILAPLAYRYVVLTKDTDSTGIQTQYVNAELLVLDAELNKQTNPTSIKVTFNNPVEAHELTHFASFSPAVLGEWEVDKSNRNIAHYKFDKKFESKSLSLYVLQGLTSINNKTLTSDYQRLFRITSNKQYAPYSRIKTFQAGKPIPLYSDGESIAIYESSVEKLLQFFIYEPDDENRRESIYSGSYLQREIEHTENAKIQNPVIDTENSTASLDPGIYYIDNDAKAPYFVIINSFGVSLRQDDKKVVLGAFDVQNGTRIDDNISFNLYNLNKSVNVLTNFTYSGNNSTVPLAYPTRLDAVIGTYKDEIAFIPVELPSSQADINVRSNLDETTKFFLYTDRPIYKPGDTVFVRGVIRQDSDALYEVPTGGSTIYVNIPGHGKNVEDIERIATLDEYGTFYTHFIIPKDAKEGTYSYVRASTKPLDKDNNTYNTAGFEVLEFVKPEFEIKSYVEKEEYTNPEKIKFTISGNYFDGKPLEGRDIEYTIYSDNYYEVEKAVYNKNFNISRPGGMCGGGGFSEYFGTEYESGKVTLDKNGVATIETGSDPKSHLSQELTLVAKTVDKNKNELVSAANTIVHGAKFNIFFIPSADRYSAGEEVVAPFYAEYLTGEKVAETTFEYSFIEYEYNYSSGKRSIDEDIITSGTIKTDKNGKGLVNFTVPDNLRDKSKKIVVTARDDRDNISESQKTIYIVSPKEKEASSNNQWGSSISQTYLKIASNQNSFKVNDTVELTIDSPKELDALVSYERGRIYNPQTVHLNEGKNTLSFKTDENLSPSITVVFSFFIDGRYHTEGISLNVPAMHKLLHIGLKPNKTSYQPSETAEVVITTKDSDGNPVAAQMSVGVVDKAIYALRKSATPPIHSSFYYFRSRNTNASSSLTEVSDHFGGGGGGGGGGSNPGSTADVLYWDPILRTDSSGEVKIQIPLLGHETIWKMQVLGSTVNTDVGQADIEFLVGSQVKGVETEKEDNPFSSFIDKLLK